MKAHRKEAAFIVAALVIITGFAIMMGTAGLVKRQNATSSVSVIRPNPYRLVPLTGNVPYLISNPQFSSFFTNMGPANGSTVLNVTLYLALTNLTYLYILVNELNTPGNALYHHYLTPSQFRAEFYPSNATVSAIKSYYSSEGFKVWSYPYAPLVVILQANITTIDKAFGITLYDYNTTLPTENSYTYQKLSSIFITNNESPSVPFIFSHDIVNVHGLSYASEVLLTKSAVGGGLYQMQDNTGSPNASQSMLTPANLEQFYQISPLLSSGYNGTGQKIGIVGVGQGLNMTAEELFWHTYGIYPTHVHIVNLTANGLNTARVGGEESLDLEWSAAIAPGASIYDIQQAFNLTGLGDNGVRLEIYYMLNVIDPNTITSSWGAFQYHHDAAWSVSYTQMSLQAVAEGTTYFEGSSDSHNINYLIGEDTPYFVAVGGIYPVLNSTGNIVGQYAWYVPSGSFYGLSVGSGGGSSFFYPKPAYQTSEAITVPSTYVNRSMPDISAPASSLAIEVNGNWHAGGGTSFAAPILAGTFADMESMLAHSHGVTAYPLGWIQPTLYNLGYNSTYGYSAYTKVEYLEPGGSISDNTYLGNGWNDWTGIGSINALNLTYDISQYPAVKTVVPQYTVSFEETGLAAGQSWTVTFNGTSQSTTSAIMSFTVPNGTYQFSIGAVSGYNISVASGNVVVQGNSALITVSFIHPSTQVQTTAKAAPAPSISPLFIIAGTIVALLVGLGAGVLIAKFTSRKQ